MKETLKLLEIAQQEYPNGSLKIINDSDSFPVVIKKTTFGCVVYAYDLRHNLQRVPLTHMEVLEIAKALNILTDSLE